MNVQGNNASPATAAQSTAKELYIVTDNDLKKLGYITRINPGNKEWAPLKLYMQSQACPTCI